MIDWHHNAETYALGVNLFLIRNRGIELKRSKVAGWMVGAYKVYLFVLGGRTFIYHLSSLEVFVAHVRGDKSCYRR